MIRLWLLGGLLFILTMTALSLHAPGALGLATLQTKNWFVAILGLSSAVYLLAVASVLRRPAPNNAVWIVLLVAAAVRLPLIFSPPFLSTDVFRYVWDGRVQAAGINPYRYVPADPALQWLRDTAIYPNIARAEYAPTIYPPFAQVMFAAIGQVWSSVTSVKLVMVGFEVVAMGCLLRLLAMARLPNERLLIYAWNPLPVWAFAGNGHVDAVAIGLLSVALLLRARHRDAWTGVMLGAAILTKFLPAVVAPAVWRRRGGSRLAAAAIVTVIALYALYSSVGWRVFGFLGGYRVEEGMDTGSGIWLLAGLAHVVTLPDLSMRVYLAAVLLLLASLGCWFAFIRQPDDPVDICGAAAVLTAVLIFAISPHYPWYYAWLAVPSVVAPYRAVLWLSAAPILLYLDTFGDRFIWPSVVFGPAVLLAVADLCGPRLAPGAKPIKGNP